MATESSILSGLVLELRRGTAVLSVLSQLAIPHYGYDLVQKLGDRGLNIEPGTLYPLLRRLEKQGLLHSSWDTTESRPRKYYSRSQLGDEVYRSLRTEWAAMTAGMSSILREGGNDNATD